VDYVLQLDTVETNENRTDFYLNIIHEMQWRRLRHRRNTPLCCEYTLCQQNWVKHDILMPHLFPWPCISNVHNSKWRHSLHAYKCLRRFNTVP